MTENAHTPFLENIPAYALGALDADETAALESHLLTCASCRDELAAYRATSDSLLMALPPQKPSAALRRRLQRQLPGARRSVRPQLNGSFGWTMAAAVFTLLLAVNVYSVLQVRALQTQQTQLMSQIQSGQTVMAMLSYPETQKVALTGDVAGTLLLDKEHNMAALVVWNLPQLQNDKTYQAWLVDPQGNRTSAGIFRPAMSGQYTTFSVSAPSGLSNTVGIGVTVEPVQGSPQPTGPRVFKADF